MRRQCPVEESVDVEAWFQGMGLSRLSARILLRRLQSLAAIGAREDSVKAHLRILYPLLDVEKLLDIYKSLHS